MFGIIGLWWSRYEKTKQWQKIVTVRFDLDVVVVRCATIFSTFQMRAPPSGLVNGGW